MRSVELAELSGLSLRQLDYWVRQGRLRTIGGRGTGHTRQFPDEEISVVCTAAELLDMGFTPTAAVELARTMVSVGEYSATVGPWKLTRSLDQHDG